MNIFAPSVEADAGQDVFLSNDPWEILKYEDITDVPVIIGVTAQEAGIFTDRKFNSTSDEIQINFIYIAYIIIFICFFILELLLMVHEFESNFSLFVPKNLNITESSMRNDVGDAIRKFYFNEKSVNQETKIEFTNVSSVNTNIEIS